MPSQEKKEKVKKIEKWFENSESVLVLRYKGLKVSEANELRTLVVKNGAELRVLKNTLTRIALTGTPHEELVQLIDGPIAVVFAGQEPTAVAKVLKDYSRGRKDFQLLGGWFKERLITGKQAEAIATLPSREVLLARMLGQAAAPLSGFVGVCAGPIRKMLGLFQALKERAAAETPAQEKGAEPEAAEAVPAPEVPETAIESEAGEPETAEPEAVEPEGEAALGNGSAPATEEEKQELAD